MRALKALLVLAVGPAIAACPQLDVLEGKPTSQQDHEWRQALLMPEPTPPAAPEADPEPVEHEPIAEPALPEPEPTPEPEEPPAPDPETEPEAPKPPCVPTATIICDQDGNPIEWMW